MSFDLSQLNIPEDIGEVLRPMVTSTIEGILDEDDLAELAAGYGPGDVRPDDDNPADLKKIREKHHGVARLVSEGLSQRLVAQICGFSETYISILLNNPAMVELVEMYRIQAGSAIKVATDKLKSVGMKALEQLEEKVDAGGMNATELTGVAKLGLDRGGLGPQTKAHHVIENHNIDHAEIAKLNAEARRRNAALIVDVKDVRKAIEPKLLEGPDDAA